MWRRPRSSLSADGDGDPERLGILPLLGEQGNTTANGTAANGAGIIEPPPADQGVSPSHPMDDQFCSFSPFSMNGHDFGTDYVFTYVRIQHGKKQHKKTIGTNLLTILSQNFGSSPGP